MMRVIKETKNLLNLAYITNFLSTLDSDLFGSTLKQSKLRLAERSRYLDNEGEILLYIILNVYYIKFSYIHV